MKWATSKRRPHRPSRPHSSRLQLEALEDRTVPASISGRVVIDANLNGMFDTGEAGVAGVTIRVTNTAGFVDTVDTDTDGNYSFVGLAAGTYTVEQVGQPQGLLDGNENATPLVNGAAPSPAVTVRNNLDSNTISNIVLAANDVGTRFDFGELRPSRISGVVYIDINKDGNRDRGERGIANVEVTLSGTNFRNQPVTRTVFTDETGAYQFINLRPSGTTGTVTGYRVTETGPKDFADGTDLAGPDGGTAGNDTISNIVLSQDVDARDYNFGEEPPIDLQLVQSPSVPVAFAGSQVVLSYVLSNRGPLAATQVVVSSPLPDGLRFISATPSQGSYDGATGLWTVGTVGNDGVVTLQVVALVTQPNLILSTGVASSERFDPDLSDNLSTAAVAGLLPPSSEVSKRDFMNIPLDDLGNPLPVLPPTSPTTADTSTLTARTADASLLTALNSTGQFLADDSEEDAVDAFFSDPANLAAL